MHEIFELASRISTPLALGGFVAAVLFFIFRQILKKNIFPSLTRSASAEVIKVIIDRLFVLALVAMVLGFAGYILPKPSQTSDPDRMQLRLNQNQSGNGNIQAGGDVTIVNKSNKQESLLEITNVRFTHDSEFDVMVRNLGDTDLIIHEIKITKIGDPGIAVAPILEPSAKYHIPVDGIPLGKSKSIDVAHVVPANSADRFLIALHTTTVYDLRVTFVYDDGKIASFEKMTWM